MKSSGPLISFGRRSYDSGFMATMMPQSNMYSRTEGGAAGLCWAASVPTSASIKRIVRINRLLFIQDPRAVTRSRTDRVAFARHGDAQFAIAGFAILRARIKRDRILRPEIFADFSDGRGQFLVGPGEKEVAAGFSGESLESYARVVKFLPIDTHDPVPRTKQFLFLTAVVPDRTYL